MIPVTKPFSPPIEEYQELLQGIWERNWFTNNGTLVLDLEEKLKHYLDIESPCFM
jgi:dTDP-4-amino-4,6-dideoxygalactose transaminase